MVILVEDDDSIRELVSEILKQLGMSFKSAASVEEAMLLLKRYTPTLLLTDLLFKGGLDARLLIEYCKVKFPSCRIVLMTAAFPEMAERAARALRIDQLICKPFNIDELESTLVKYTECV